MKKRNWFSALLAGMMLISMMSAFVLPAVADTGDWTFTVSDGKATLTAYNGAAEEIAIPAAVTQDGTDYPVVALGQKLFYQNVTVTKVTIPEGITSIGDYVFYGCTALTAATLPESLTSLGNCAFTGCSGLTAITLPKGITALGYSTFKNCTGLIAVALPEGLTSMGNSAFEGCTALPSITLPQGLTTLGSYVFAQCSSLTSMELPKITSYGTSVFSGCTALTSVTFADGMTIVGREMFGSCKALETVTLPDSIKRISTGAFYKCTSLVSLELPKNLQIIDGTAFSGCTSLAFIELPVGLTTLGINSFNGCEALTSIEIPAGVTSFGSGAFYGCSGLTSVTFQEGLSVIGASAFYNCIGLTEVTIPESVKTIGNSAFDGCVHLKTVHILGKETTLGTNAFPDNAQVIAPTVEPEWEYTIADNTATLTAYGGSATEVAIPETVKKDGVFYPVTALGSNLFKDNTTITSVTVPERVTSIGSYAFYGCTNLAAVTLPETMDYLGIAAFAQCKALESIVIPEGITTILNSTFSGCTSLSSVTLPDTLVTIDTYAFNACSVLQEIVIPEGVTTIRYGAFQQCYWLYELTVPTTLTKMEGYAFYNCPLQKVYISDLGAWLKINFGANSYTGARLYLRGVELTDAVIPEGVTAIPDYAFRNCKNLYSVTFPEGLKTIGKGAFQNCSNLWQVYNVPDSLAEIKADAFAASSVYVLDINDLAAWCGVRFANAKAHPLCNAGTSGTGSLYLEGVLLKTLEVPEGITAIHDYAFNYCSNFFSITLPEGVTSIGQNAFYGCYNTATLSVPTTLETVGSNAFYGAEAPTVNIKDLSAWCAIDFADEGAMPIPYYGDLYLNGETLGDVVIPAGITEIKPYTFQNTDITSVTIPKEVTSIGAHAFENCVNMTSLTLLSDTLTIGDFAFSDCEELLAVEIAGDITTIGEQAFSFCRKLKTFDIPKSVTSIGDGAFYHCLKLDNIIIPYNVKWVGDGAFVSCDSLKKFYYTNWRTEFGITYSFPAYMEEIDPSKAQMTLDEENTNLAVLNTKDYHATRVYWGYAGTEAVEAEKWTEFTVSIPAEIRVSDYNPAEGEVYAMSEQGYYIFWIQYTDAQGNTHSTCQTVYAEGALDINYGKPYLELDDTGKVARINTNGTTVQKLYWGYIGETDYAYETWDEFKARIGDTYLPDYGVKEDEGYIVNKVGYYRFVIVYLDAQGTRQERYFTVKINTPATAPLISNSTLSNVASFVNEDGYVSKVYYGYIGTENTKYVDFNSFKANAQSFGTSFGTKEGATFKLDKAGYWRFVINYTVNGATKDAVCTVYVDEADLALGTPKLTQRGKEVTLGFNGASVSKVYIGYMGTEAVEIDSWADYTANRQTNATYYGPKDGTAFPLGTAAGYYTVVVSYNTGGADQLAFYTFQI